MLGAGGKETAVAGVEEAFYIDYSGWMVYDITHEICTKCPLAADMERGGHG